MKHPQKNLEERLLAVQASPDGQKQLEDFIRLTFQSAADFVQMQDMTNAQLKQLLSKIQIDPNGNVDVYLHSFAETISSKPL